MTNKRLVSQRAFAVTSAGIEGGKNLAESAQDLERTRKAISVQLDDFEGVKKLLMRDLQNRCEKVCNRLSCDASLCHFAHGSCVFCRLSSSRFSWTRSRSSITT